MEYRDIVIYNGNVLTSHRELPGGSIWVKDGKIQAVSTSKLEVNNAQYIDAQGRYISPGFIELHVHGGGGYDFMDGTIEAFLGIAKTHAQYGTTAMFPTTLSGDWKDFLQVLDIYPEAHRLNTEGARFMGVHIEGPYLAMSQKGAQDPRYIRPPVKEEYEYVIRNYPYVKRWSIAPELPGAIEFGTFMRQHGVISAIAHTDAIYEEVIEAHEVGFNLATHFYSAMSGVTRRNAYRYAGSVEATYALDSMDVEIIADGAHLPGSLLKLIVKQKGVDSIALITDAMRAAGMPEGPSLLGTKKNGLPCIVEDGVAKLVDRSSFAGSVATADRLIRTMLEKTDVSMVEAVRMASLVPARIMKVDDETGSITAQKDADIVLFDDNIEISMTMVGGKIIYEKE
ncbi:N-acetylglucosamine-6-phosphate deacetylase [Membranihabitans marinus]|uniref:N-acetylglucosamine-6-phosphate deacetylase n=1 Tax=Membranihabitans marinus TaxID=1227546 RepID=UPI001F00FAC4|nr:N-acetylglucosamine-6-phosphate deacetylase [Membranihabitans marinus]